MAEPVHQRDTGLTYCRRGEQCLQKLMYRDSKKWNGRHDAMLLEGRKQRPYVPIPSNRLRKHSVDTPKFHWSACLE